MTSSKKTAQLLKRYEILKAKTAEPGLLLVGTIIKRMDKRPHPKDPRKTKTYGPYYQWTFKVEGKSRTVNLTAKQAKEYKKAIENHRKLQEHIATMRQLSLKILEQTTEGVRKRKTSQSKAKTKTRQR
jgi:hypothetical protein